MKLKRARIREYKSIWDSGEIETGDVTCLVGKNEAGKTAILEALKRLNPVDGQASFDVTEDYPRSEVEDYQQDVEAKKRKHAVVVEAWFSLGDQEMQQVHEAYGKQALPTPEVKLSKGYQLDKQGRNTLWIDLNVDERAIVRYFLQRLKTTDRSRQKAKSCMTIADLKAILAKAAQVQDQEAARAKSEAAKFSDEQKKASALDKCKKLGESEQAKSLRAHLDTLPSDKSFSLHIWSSILKPFMPRFMYFDEYYQMKGSDNIQALKRRQENDELKPSDHPLIGLIELARLDIDGILSINNTQSLKNKLEGASTHLSKKVLKYWSQNKHVEMRFDVRQGMSNDPEGMRDGTNIWGEVYDKRRFASTRLDTRSTGFVWFFSFLAWYSSLEKKDQPLVLLLDEPGLSLHGKAQGDLLRYFDDVVAKNTKHQLIYTTHSPFMVDPAHFDRVRIVQDKGIDAEEDLPRNEDGTKVLTEVLEAGEDSLFPLQGALGYELYQTLFIGPNCLIVEGVSDLLYLQVLSGALSALGRVSLDERWTITPVGGADKVPTFVALIGAEKNLKVATLIDFEKSRQQMVENLYKKKLLKKSHVLTYADFTNGSEADVEDMFDVSFYVGLLNDEFGAQLQAPIEEKQLPNTSERMVNRVEQYLKASPMKGGVKFNHYRPARLLAEKASNYNIPTSTLDRFEEAFNALNALL